MSEAFSVGERAVERALQLNDSLADAHATVAIIRCALRGDSEQVHATFRRALSLDPNSGRAHYFHAFCLSLDGRISAALEQAQRAVQLEPLNAQFATGVGRIHMVGGQPRRGITVLEAALEIAPNLATIYVLLAQAYADVGDWPRAEWAAANVERTHPVPAVAAVMRAYTAARQGNREQALAHLRAAGDTPPLRLMYTAAVHAALGEQQRAMEFLELTFAESSDYFGFVHHPVFDPLRGTAEFREFARRYNLPVMVERLN